ncbi:MAG: hypothetical protein ACRDF4_08640, partial [Rhabdochlamydiaceae bacterium]
MSEYSQLEEIMEEILKNMSANKKSYKADRLIEEFTRKVIDQSHPLQALKWITSQSHELGHSGIVEDMHEAISTSYFTVGFMTAWVNTRLLDLKENARQSNRSR